MNIIPFREVVISSKFNKQHATEQLALHTYPSIPNGLPLSRQGFSTVFTGQVNDSSFRIRRVINYGKNSFIPDIKGEITETPSGSDINITFRLHSFTLVFIIIWLTLCMLAGVVTIYNAAVTGNYTPAVFIPFGMFVFAGALVSLSFNYEYKTARQELERIFDAR
jgi:hypothetical protein